MRVAVAPQQGSPMPSSGQHSRSKVAPTAPLASQLHTAGAAGPGTEPAAGHELERGVNLRDLSSVDSRIQPGRVHRSSQVVSAAELEQLRIAAVLDLRQPSVRCKTHAAGLAASLRRKLADCLGWVAASTWGGRRAASWRRRGGGAAAGTQPCHLCTSECCHHYGIPARVYHVDLLPTRVSLRILWELPGGIQARVLWAAVRRRHAEPIVAGAVADPQVLGYLRLYTILLDRAGPRLAEALRLAADPGNLPLLVHCIHGKDRTGLVCMLLLRLCGVERGAVVRDYALSESLLLEGRQKRRLLGLPEHLATDHVIAAAAAVMESTMDHLERRHGSAFNYCKRLGLSEGELAAIVRNVTQRGLELPPRDPAAACEKED